MRNMLVAVWLMVAVGSALAQVPAAELAKPPANARHFVIQSTGGKHGDSWSWVTADGTRMGAREHEPARPGVRARLERQGRRGRHAGVDRDPRRDAAGRCGRNLHHRRRQGETGRARWMRAARAIRAPAFYVSQGGPIDMTAWLLERCSRAPTRHSTLLPGGKARAEKLTDLDVGEGAAKQTITLWAITGISTSPVPVWADANNKFFGFTFGLALAAGSLRQRTGEDSRRRRRTRWPRRRPALRKSLVKVPTGAGRIHQRAAVRRRSQALPRRSDGDRRQGHDRRGRRSRRP